MATKVKVTQVRDKIAYLQNKKSEWIKMFEFSLSVILVFVGILVGHAFNTEGLTEERVDLLVNKTESKVFLNNTNTTIIFPEIHSLSLSKQKGPDFSGIYKYLKDALYLFIIIASSMAFAIFCLKVIHNYNRDINELYEKLPGVKTKN